MIVRKVEYEDLDRLIELGKAMREESEIPYPKIERTPVKEFIGNTKFKPYDYLGLVADDGEIWGFMAALAGKTAFSSATIAAHHIFFVHPEKRGTLAAPRLIKAYEQWAEAIGAVHTVIAVDTAVHPEKTGKFYEKMGYTHMGGKYVKWEQSLQS